VCIRQGEVTRDGTGHLENGLVKSASKEANSLGVNVPQHSRNVVSEDREDRFIVLGEEGAHGDIALPEVVVQ